MTATPRTEITDAEWEIMQILWQEGPLGLAELLQGLESRRDWAPATVKTLLRRLVDKGAVSRRGDGRRFTYRAALHMQAVQRRESRRLLSRLFGGDPCALVSHLLDDQAVDAAQLDALQELIDAARRRHAD